MRTIRETLRSDKKVWVYLNNEKTWKQFVTMAVSEGFHFGNLPRDQWVFGHVIAVHSDGSMGHVSLFLWCRSFAADVVNFPRKIDFEKVICWDSDFYCENSHFVFRMIGSYK